jgi:Na+-transporting methylmalonyl-CoA/oxaloacetate decarboxylase gamma subunit
MATLNSLVIIFSGTGLVLAALALLAFIVASVAAFFFWLINRVA